MHWETDDIHVPIELYGSNKMQTKLKDKKTTRQQAVLGVPLKFLSSESVIKIAYSQRSSTPINCEAYRQGMKVMHNIIPREPKPFSL